MTSNSYPAVWNGSFCYVDPLEVNALLEKKPHFKSIYDSFLLTLGNLKIKWKSEIKFFHVLILVLTFGLKSLKLLSKDVSQFQRHLKTDNAWKLFLYTSSVSWIGLLKPNLFFSPLFTHLNPLCIFSLYFNMPQIFL